MVIDSGKVFDIYSDSRLIDISCLTRDRFVHHTLTNKCLLNGGFSKLNISFHLFWVADQTDANQELHSPKLIDC